MCHPFLGKSPQAGEPKVHPEPWQEAVLTASIHSHPFIPAEPLEQTATVPLPLCRADSMRTVPMVPVC